MKKIEDERWDEKERLMVGVKKIMNGGGKIIKNREGTWDEGVRITLTVLLFHVLNLTLFWAYRSDQCRIHLFAQSASAPCTKK